MGIKTTHKEYITERIYLEYLKQGVIPTSDMIEADLAAYLEEHPSLEVPVSKSVDLSVGRGGSSSASLVHKAGDLFSDDVGIITREIYRVSKESQSFYDRWLHEVGRLAKKARNLEDRIDSLLLLAYDTAGYFAHISDTFSDMTKVDTISTIAKVDLDEGAVTINPEKVLEDGNLGTQIKLDFLTPDEVSFIPLTVGKDSSYSSLTDLVSIFKMDSSSWVGTVTSNKDGEMIAELKARINRTETTKVSKIVISYTGEANEGDTITALYSKNGHEWTLAETKEATKVLQPKITWFFPLTDVKWIKFIIRRTAADETVSGKPTYNYQISNIKLYGHNYIPNNNNIFFSKALSANDLSGQPSLFSTVALEACDEVPDNTDIEYYTAASSNGEDWTDWTRIEPVEKEDTILPKVINFGGIEWVENKDNSDIKLIDTSLTGDTAPLKLTSPSDNTFEINSEIDTFTGYRLKEETFKMVNTALIPPPNTEPSFITGNLVMWRNIRNKDDEYPDVLTVRDVPRGWGLNGSIYSCYFEIKDTNGRRLNFGPNECVIDGEKHIGSVLLPKGVHSFQTDTKYWFDISEEIEERDSSVIPTEETLRKIDPLYPYNHKLVIEGFPYEHSFTGEKVYIGADLSAEFYCRKVSLFDLENNSGSNLGLFAVREIGTDDSRSVLAVIVKIDSENVDFENELSLIRWKTADEDAGYNQVKLKAVLNTDVNGITPAIYSYRIKLGV